MMYPDQRGRLKRQARANKGWATRRDNRRRYVQMHCLCPTPKPTNDGLWLRLASTVECERCGRAIFAADGTPVRT